VSEQAANVLRITATAATASAWVAAIKVAIPAHGTRWTVADGTVTDKVLLTCTATGGQIVFTAGSAQDIRVGYEPAGGLADANAVPSSGIRRLTGINTLVPSGADAVFYLAEYEDALLLALRSSTTWRYAALAGALINPLDASDAPRGYAHALLVGVPTDSFLAGTSWFYGAFGTAYTADSSVCYLGSGVWAPFLPDISKQSAVTSTALSRIGTTERFLPYLVRPRDAANVGLGVIGATKYLRQWRAILSFESKLFSGTLGSEQAWMGGLHPGALTGHVGNQLILWAKTETAVVI
jgi:hypothetical protein